MCGRFEVGTQRVERRNADQPDHEQEDDWRCQARARRPWRGVTSLGSPALRVTAPGRILRCRPNSRPAGRTMASPVPMPRPGDHVAEPVRRRGTCCSSPSAAANTMAATDRPGLRGASDRHEHHDDADRGHRRGDGVTGRERRRARWGSSRRRRPRPVDDRLERTDAELRSDDGAGERHQLQPTPSPRQGSENEEAERDHHRGPPRC